jgi:phosphatidylglycerophosphate synthase
MFYRLLSPITNGLLKILTKIFITLHITPNILTVSGFCINLIAGYLLMKGYFFWGAIIVLCANIFDMLDGLLARESGNITPFGAFLDSVIDRYSDMVLLLGLFIYYSQSNSTRIMVVIGFAFIGSIMTSYTRARSENLIKDCKVGYLERPERIGFIILGGVANRMPMALFFIAILSNITVIHRIYHTWSTVKAQRKMENQS